MGISAAAGIAIAKVVALVVGAGAAVATASRQQVSADRAERAAKGQEARAVQQIADTKKADAAAAAKAEEESAAIAAKEQQDIAAAESARASDVLKTKRTTAARELALQETGRPSTFASGNTFGLRSAAPVKKKKLGQ